MNPEDKLRDMLRSGAGSATPKVPSWQEFAPVAHRSILMRRLATAGAAVVVLAGAAVAYTLVPGGGGTKPVASPTTASGSPVPTHASGCPRAEAPSFGDLGAVAFVRRTGLHVVDLAGRTERVIDDALAPQVPPDLHWSPDGRWIAFDGNRLAPATLGAACSPLPLGYSIVGWVPGSELFVAMTNREGLVIGSPGGDVKTLLPDGWGVTDALIDPRGTSVAVARVVGDPSHPQETGIYTVDLSSGKTTQIQRFPGADASSVLPRLASWSPDGAWLLYWRGAGSASLASDGGELYAVAATGASPTKVTEMLMDRDMLDWCGDTLVAASGLGRELDQNKRLITAAPPDWKAAEVPSQPPGSVYWPSCSPDGKSVSATVVDPGQKGNVMAPKNWIAVIDFEGVTGAGLSPATGGGFSANTFSSEFPEWSPKPVPGQSQAILFVGRGDVHHQSGALYLERGEQISKVADLGSVGLGYYGYYDYARRVAWYQP